MRARSIRGRLAADPALGAGNVLSTLVSLGVDPDEPTLTFDTDVDGHPAWKPLTLGELDRAVATRSAGLHALGVRPRDPVAVYGVTAADQMLSFLALVRLGAIPALVNGNLRGAVAARYISGLKAVGVLADAASWSRLAEHDPGAPLLGAPDRIDGHRPSDAPAPYRHHPDDPIAITHSSGTTGEPKAVTSTHATLFAAIRHRLSVPRAQGADRILCALPAAHNATLTALNLALGNRGEILLLSAQDGGTVVDAVRRWRPGMVLGFAVTWSQLAHAELDADDLESVRVWWNTGDCAHEAHIRRLVAVGSHDVATGKGIEHRAGSMFVDGLGSTELGHSQFHITHRADSDRFDRCIGRPHLFAQAEVLDPSGEPLPAGRVGQLAVRSPTVTPGYWNDSAATYRTRQGGWFLPGELVYRTEDGYYHHVDRAADAIDLGDGTHVYTALSEDRVLAACPEVLDCTVVAVRHGTGVSTHVLLRLAPGADPAVDRTEEVRAALRDERVAATVRRVAVVPEEEIPLGATGKVLKAVLRARYSSAEATAP
ncbi:class I adenylate-forming enzyme family protein [Streptacidiphilus sp. EB129]|uniref:class I adenylate-forming enzyme family protein n=1 Tax=Streptacidiphilus sp. EB129 TaxID=3156262 RepID=UPI0035157474